MPYQIGSRNYCLVWEVAERWGIAPQTVRQYVRDGEFAGAIELPITKRGTKRVYLIPLNEAKRVERTFGYESSGSK